MRVHVAVSATHGMVEHDVRDRNVFVYESKETTTDTDRRQ